jgi:hypothetical protein
MIVVVVVLKLIFHVELMFQFERALLCVVVFAFIVVGGVGTRVSVGW